MKQLSDLIKQYVDPVPFSEMLELYSHIELTEDEINEAILTAKMKKDERLKAERNRQIAEENRRIITQAVWTPEEVRNFFLWRAGQLYGGNFKLDAHSEPIFNLLCHYFSASSDFLPLAKDFGVKEPSLEKGIALQGNYGRGKTWMLKVFTRNRRQVFKIKRAKDIAADFETLGEEKFDERYLKLEKNAINDRDNFFQTYMGLGIDDLGSEKEKNHYGNKKNVIGDLIEAWYEEWNRMKQHKERKIPMDIYFHLTTNLNAEELVERYTGRVTSRMREMFNFILVGGEDRRK